MIENNYLQKFSTNKRPIGGINPDETLTRFPWFSLSGLEQFSSSMAALQQMHASAGSQGTLSPAMLLQYYSMLPFCPMTIDDSPNIRVGADDMTWNFAH